MTPQDKELLASLTGYTPGPWTGWNMIHADTGLPMTPDELGEMVKNNVLQSIKNGGSAERFMFVSGETPIGPADMCHVGNGPNGLRNTALIAAAPDLHRIATEQAAEIVLLKEALGDMVDLFSADNVLLKGTHLNATLILARRLLYSGGK